MDIANLSKDEHERKLIRVILAGDKEGKQPRAEYFADLRRRINGQALISACFAAEGVDIPILAAYGLLCIEEKLKTQDAYQGN